MTHSSDAGKKAGLAGMFLKSIAATNANGLAARPAARAVSVAPAPEPRATEAELEAAPVPASLPQPPSKHALARSLLRTVATVDANGLNPLRPSAAPTAQPAPLDPTSPRASLRTYLGKFIR